MLLATIIALVIVGAVFWAYATKDEDRWKDPNIVILQHPTEAEEVKVLVLEEQKEEHKPPITEFTDFCRYSRCLECKSLTKVLTRDLCAKCGSEKFEMIIGQYEETFIPIYGRGMRFKKDLVSVFHEKPKSIES